jgi:hypothetical protein
MAAREYYADTSCAPLILVRQMKPHDAILLTAMLILVVVLLAWFSRRRGGKEGFRQCIDFCPTGGCTRWCL